jgi:hypothetical protein
MLYVGWIASASPRNDGEGVSLRGEAEAIQRNAAKDFPST